MTTQIPSGDPHRTPNPFCPPTSPRSIPLGGLPPSGGFNLPVEQLCHPIISASSHVATDILPPIYPKSPNSPMRSSTKLFDFMASHLRFTLRPTRFPIRLATALLMTALAISSNQLCSAEKNSSTEKNNSADNNSIEENASGEKDTSAAKDQNTPAKKNSPLTSIVESLTN
ncbi:MAG: hypothetical protein ACF787_11455 [Rhodopirellula sp. JB053]